MNIDLPKNKSQFLWTNHAKDKMKYYQLSESRVLRVFNNPTRVEEGIVENTVAVMQPTTAKHTSEIWLMYQLDKDRGIIIITAWRYPGVSPKGMEIPVPEEIRKELQI